MTHEQNGGILDLGSLRILLCPLQCYWSILVCLMISFDLLLPRECLCSVLLVVVVCWCSDIDFLIVILIVCLMAWVILVSS